MKLENKTKIYTVDNAMKHKNDHNMHIFIKVDEKQLFEIVVNETERVSDIMYRILKRCSIQGLNARLMYDGVYLDDEQIVKQCGCEEGSMMILTHGLRGGMQIYVRNIEGRIYTIEVSPDETIRDLKIKILEKSGFALNDQRLVFRGNVLNDTQTIREAAIDSKSEINLVIRQSETVKVHCMMMDTDDFEAEVQLLDTVLDLKRKISKHSCMSVRDMEIIFNTRILRNADTIRDSGITNECGVNVIAKKNSFLVVYLGVALLIVLLVYEFINRLS